jgi:hypothetical protein
MTMEKTLNGSRFTTQHFKHALRNPYAWPGGYPTYLVMSDGGALCMKCAKRERALIYAAIVDGDTSGWRAEAQAVNWEDAELCCDNCGGAIESAYGEK